MKDFPLPVVAFGPGSQDQDEGFDYLPMPGDMDTFQPPRIADDAPAAVREASLDMLRAILATMRGWKFGESPAPTVDLGGLEPDVLQLVNDALGQGEVSARVEGAPAWRIQETVFAGVWRVIGQDAAGATIVDRVELGANPSLLVDVARNAAALDFELAAQPPGVMNAPPILAEIRDVVARRQDGEGPHIINLTLLPVTPADLSYLSVSLGAGPTVILSRGYGNCRVSSTGLRDTWWVQYYNNSDTLILNTIEITPLPDVVPAAREDFEDSVSRLSEWIDALADNGISS